MTGLKDMVCHSCRAPLKRAPQVTKATCFTCKQKRHKERDALRSKKRWEKAMKARERQVAKHPWPHKAKKPLTKAERHKRQGMLRRIRVLRLRSASPEELASRKEHILWWKLKRVLDHPEFVTAASLPPLLRASLSRFYDDETEFGIYPPPPAHIIVSRARKATPSRGIIEGKDLS